MDIVGGNLHYSLDEVCAINSYSVVRPPGFELPNRILSGFPGRWLGRPMDAPGYVLDQARLRPHEASRLALGSSTLSLPEKDARQKIGIKTYASNKLSPANDSERVSNKR